jgi:hypothetical protein
MLRNSEKYFRGNVAATKVNCLGQASSSVLAPQFPLQFAIAE